MTNDPDTSEAATFQKLATGATLEEWIKLRDWYADDSNWRVYETDDMSEQLIEINEIIKHLENGPTA